MTKVEFLAYLEKRLQVINQKEREDLLAEYAQHIDMKMASGMSEEEAVKDFGDVHELADELLEAYNINPDYDKKKIDMEQMEKNIGEGWEKVKGGLGTGWGKTKHGMSKLFGGARQAVEGINDHGLKETFMTLILLALMMGLLFAGFVAGTWVVEEVARIFFAVLLGWLPYSLYFVQRLLRWVVVFCFWGCYLLLAFSLCYNFVINRLGKGRKGRSNETMANNGSDPDNGAVFGQSTGDSEFAADAVAAVSEDKPKRGFHLQLPQLKMPRFQREEAYAGAGFGGSADFSGEQNVRKKDGRSEQGGCLVGLLQLCRVCLVLMFKFVVLIMFIPLVLAEIAAIVGLGILLVALLMGFPVIGILLADAGAVLCGGVLAILIWDVVFARKGEKKHA